MRAIRSNPFVVLADVTIALCFIFAVYAVASTALNSQLVLFFDRDTRQKALHSDLQAAIESVWGKQPSGYVETSDGWKYLQVGPKGHPVAQIWMNSSFQRVTLYHPLFKPGSSELDDTAKRLYLKLGEVIAGRATDLSYVYIHGIAEAREQRLAPRTEDSADWARKLSVERATEVFNLLQKKGTISAFGAKEIGPQQLEAKYVIPYGTGSALYTQDTNVGRVDLVLFYGDVSNQAFGAAARRR